MRKRYSLTFFLRQGFQGIFRNGISSFVSVTVLVSCLIVIGSLALLLLNLNVNLDDLGAMNEIQIFAEYDATDEELTALEAKLAAIGGVTGVKHLTKDEIYNEMRPTDGSGSVWQNFSDENNPLSDEFVLTYATAEDATTIVYHLRQMEQNGEGIRKISDRMDLASSLESLKNSVVMVFAWFLGLLLIVCLFVIMNTIRLALYARRTEIMVMRYVGATGSFITLPFVFEGFVLGGVASAIAFFIEKYLYGYVESLAVDKLQMIKIVAFNEISWYVLGGFAIIGVLTGIIGSCISIGKYLKT